MEQKTALMQDFRLPRYNEIPGVGLYLEQTTKYIAECLAPLQGDALTASMISNYVKRGLIDSPVKKQYSRDQIAYLIFITVVKAVLSMDNIRVLIGVQKNSYAPQVAYDYFCSELENILDFVFGKKELPDIVGTENTEEKIMLRNTTITVAYKIYLDRMFHLMREQEAE